VASQSIAFSASEYHADGGIRPAAYAFSGSTADGWEIRRNGAVQLRLGAGYELVRVSHCGVCSTDLARRHLPFPLPQITGHEVVALDDAGAPVVVEINASHAGRALDRSAWCNFCRNDLETHCPDRLVLGIHDLPGGFSPWLLAPTRNVHRVPDRIDSLTATLVEPFAAALHAVRVIAPRDGDRVAVLGPRRLGSLMIAALAAWRMRSGRRYEILAIARRAEMRALALALGADEVMNAATVAAEHDLADVVVDTTGNPNGLALAVQLARREAHVKSTTGQPTLGLTHLTELVVDEITLASYRDEGVPENGLASPAPTVAALLGDVPSSIARTLSGRGLRVVRGDSAADFTMLEEAAPALGGADLAVVASLAAIDHAIRPQAGVERGLVRARGTICVVDVGQPRDRLLAALLDKRLRISTSRCGDFGAALDLLADPATQLGGRLGEKMVTDVFPAARLADALDAAARPSSIKVLVAHAGARL